MKKYIPIILIVLLSIGLVKATSVNTTAQFNGTGQIDTTYTSGDSVIRQIVYIDGVAYLNITYDDGTSELIQYIQQNEDDWLRDERGISEGKLADMLSQAIYCALAKKNCNNGATLENCNFGIKEHCTDENINEIADAILAYENYYNQELSAIINDLGFRTEALENTVDPDKLCQAKLEVMQEYGLTGVKCGDTYYRNHMESPTGESIIVGLTPANGKPTKPENMTKLESNIVIDSLDVPDKVYLDKPFSLKAMVKNQGDETTEDYITLALPEGWEAITPTYYTVNLEKGQSQIVYFGIKPTTTSGEIAVGSSVDFKSASIRAQPLSITSRVIQPISKFMGTLDITILGILVACIAIPVLFIMKKSTIMGIVHQAKPGTRFNYSYRVK